MDRFIKNVFIGVLVLIIMVIGGVTTYGCNEKIDLVIDYEEGEIDDDEEDDGGDDNGDDSK